MREDLLRPLHGRGHIRHDRTILTKLRQPLDQEQITAFTLFLIGLRTFELHGFCDLLPNLRLIPLSMILVLLLYAIHPVQQFSGTPTVEAPCSARITADGRGAPGP